MELVDLQAFPAEGGRSDQRPAQEIWRALRRRRRLVGLVAVVVLSGSLVNAVRQRLFAPTYQGSFELLISDPISSGPGRASNSDGGVVESLARNRTSIDLPSLIRLLRSPSVLEPVASRFSMSAGQLAGGLTIAPVSGLGSGEQVNGVLGVALRGTDPALLGSQLEALSRTYLSEALSQRRLRLTEGLRFLDDQEPKLEQRVQAAQAQLASFRVRHSLIEPEGGGLALSGEVQGLLQQQRQLQAERARLLSLRQGVASGRITAGNFSAAIGGSGGQASSVPLSQPESDRLNQLAELERKLAEARLSYLPDSDRVRDLEVAYNQLSRALRGAQLRAVDTALAFNRLNQSALGGQRRDVQAAFRDQPELIRQYEELQQRLKIASDNLASFIKTRETFQLELAQDTVPWRVISPPSVGSIPVEPNLQQALLQALLLGLGAGAVAGLVRDRFDHVFHHPSEVREELQQPLLGHVPHVPFFKGVRTEQSFLLGALKGEAASPDPEQRRQDRYHRFFYQEALRNLYTSLRFVSADKPLRSVALTSSLPAEGKSLVNVLLAKTLADMGQRVLLVDADLRKPQLHHRLGVNNLTGLTNLLADDSLHWQEAVQPVPDHANWWLLTAGARAPDPARLFSSARAGALVREIAASGHFDLVLYDTPPVLGLADAALLAEQLDGLILLVGINRVDRGLPREAIDRILSAGAPLLGVVTNAVTDDHVGGGAYGYGYGGYRYGYAPYDASAAYAYYNPESNDSEQPAGAAARRRRSAAADAKAVGRSGAAAAGDRPGHWFRSLVRWIDS